MTAAHGYKTGGHVRLSNNAALGGPPDVFDEATSWTYEAGIKHRSGDGSRSLDAAIFYNEVKDEHLLVQDVASLQFVPANIDTVSYGFEVQGRKQLTPKLNLAGGFGYTHAELRNVPLSVQASVNGQSGNLVPNVPGVTANAALDYKDKVSWPAADGNIDVFANLNWRFTGARAANVANDFDLPAYHIVNAKAGFEPAKGLQIYAFVENLLNVTPELSGVSFPGAIEAVNPGRDRVWGVGGVYRWSPN